MHFWCYFDYYRPKECGDVPKLTNIGIMTSVKQTACAGECRILKSLLASKSGLSLWTPIKALDAALRGISQVGGTADR